MWHGVRSTEQNLFSRSFLYLKTYRGAASEASVAEAVLHSGYEQGICREMPGFKIWLGHLLTV